jgi:Tol biopolymer transport system component
MPFYPQLLPDGENLLFTVGGELQPEGSQKVFVQSLASGKRKELFTGKGAQYLPTGHLIYRLKNSLFAVRFNSDTLNPVGGPVSVIENMQEFTVSDTGTIVYITGTTSTTSERAERTLVWVDRNGKEEPLAFEHDAYAVPSISPDGTKVALVIGGPMSTNIWVLDLIRHTRTRLTDDETADLFPLWTPDGNRIVYFSYSEKRAGICWRPADGTGEVEFLASGPESIFTPASWSADGKTLALDKFKSDIPLTTVAPLIVAAIERPGVSLSDAPGTKLDILLLSLEGDRELKTLLADKYIELVPQISPDGRWIAYVSVESDQPNVYVRPYPEVNSGKWPVSTSNGWGPVWSPDGKELFYLSDGWMMSVPIESGTAFKAGVPQKLFKGDYYDFWTGEGRIHPDGKRFLMIKPTPRKDSESGEAAPDKINIVLNWFEELKERVPVD